MLLSLAGAATSIIFVVTKVLLGQAYFCHHKRCVLSQQKYACHKKLLRQTKLCLLRQISFTAKVLSPQTCVCHDKSFFVTTKLLLLQPYFSCDKRCVLSRQKLYLCQLSPMICYSISHTLANRVYIHVYIYICLLTEHHLNLP